MLLILVMSICIRGSIHLSPAKQFIWTIAKFFVYKPLETSSQKWSKIWSRP